MNTITVPQHPLAGTGPHGTSAIVGILGGMGPLATADLMTKVILNTPASCDQDHVPLVVLSMPAMPSRIDAILHGGPSPLPAMLAGLRLLQAAGAGLIAMPCNTAHHWHADLALACELPVLHIVDCTIAQLQAHEARVGVLGSAGTRKMRLYTDALRASGREPVEPTALDQRQWVDAAIDDVKAGRLAQGTARLRRAIDALAAQRVDAIVLGCTELPVAWAGQPYEGPARLVDATTALARACVDWHRLSGSMNANRTIAHGNPLARRLPVAG